MSTRDDVLDAPNPRAALLVLADAIDRLQSKPADPWGEWDALDQGQGLADGEGSVEQEPIGATGEPQIGGPFTKQEDEGVAEFDFPLPNDFQRAIRTQLREYLDFENLHGRDENGNAYRLFPREDTPERQAEVAKLHDAFGKAGPVWLYLANRDHVLELPIDVRQRMIDDVQEVDPKYAYHMAKDILMDRGDQGTDLTALPMRSDSTGAVE